MIMPVSVRTVARYNRFPRAPCVQKYERDTDDTNARPPALAGGFCFYGDFAILASMNDELQSEDIDFEPEDELGETGAAKAKLKQLREELKEAKAKRDEYLDGWQRCKADAVNAKKDAQETATRAAGRGKEILVEELIPALDGFDMAMQGSGWESVDKAWRSGVESIKGQIEGVLKAHGVEIYGTEGEKFDPSLHEPIQEAEGGDSHTIAKVFRRGYRTKERVLRPAQVSVFT